MDHRRTPLFDALKKHLKKNPTSFHVPGHKNGTVFFSEAYSLYQQILKMDVTEISGMDDLHHPKGVIKEAEELTSNLYGSISSHFLVGGTTVGNLAMIMGTVEKGDTILVQRNSHQSVFHAIELSGANPILLEVEVDKDTGLALGVSLETLNTALQLYKKAKAIVLTNPSYEGYGQDLTYHIQAAHKENMTVIVDEAHGPHLLFEDERWPKTSLKAGADLVVQSVHKMLPAMTMTSLLHINSNKVNKNKIQRLLTMLQSSSPSYPLMASLDVARAFLAEKLQSMKQGEITDNLVEFKHMIGSGSSWYQAPPTIGNYIQDPLKVAIMTASGSKLQKILEDNDIYPELVSPNHVLLTLPLTEEESILHKLQGELQQVLQGKEGLIAKSLDRKGWNRSVYLQRNPSVSELELSFSEVESLPTERIHWEDTVGRISAETITPYPPGVPAVLKGEKITTIHKEKLSDIVHQRINLQTSDEWKANGILVVKKSGNEEI